MQNRKRDTDVLKKKKEREKKTLPGLLRLGINI